MIRNCVTLLPKKLKLTRPMLNVSSSKELHTMCVLEAVLLSSCSRFELLSVVTIIAVPAALLFPAISSF